MRRERLEELLEAKGKTLVMDDNGLRAYAFDRKLHPDSGIKEEQIAGLSKVIIHNAATTADVDALFRRMDVVPLKYMPEKSSEAHYYVSDRGQIHVVNSRGVTRLKRDENLVAVLGYALGRELGISVMEYHGAASKSSHHFEHLAFELVEDAFQNLDTDAMAGSQRLNLLLGPHASLNLGDIIVEHERHDDFLNYRILRIGNEIVVNFDYIFADQARNVLHKIYSTVSADFRSPKIDINVLHYGRVGILDNEREIGQIFIPTYAMEEENIISGMLDGSEIQNELSGKRNKRTAAVFEELAGRVYEGTTINTISVLGQTVENLEAAKNAGGHLLDMEWSAMASLSQGSKSTYPNLGNIRYYFAGIGSDKPLEGKTLGNTQYPEEVERKVANAMKEIIRRL